MSDHLRPAVPEDASEIARLVFELGYSATREEVKDRLLRFVDSGEVVAFVAVADDGSLLGWVSGERRLSLESGTTYEITGLVVDSRARRRGVGEALVSSIEAWARSFGASSLVVRSNVLREESHDFYQAHGYLRQKTQHAYRKKL